jgi:hypothetical protein
LLLDQDSQCASINTRLKELIKMKYPQAPTTPQLIHDICAINSQLQREANRLNHNTRWTYRAANWQAMEYSALHNCTAVVTVNRLGDCEAMDISAWDGQHILTTYTNGERAPRPDYRSIPGADCVAYRNAQKAMFGAAHAAGLDTNDRDGMIQAACHVLRINISSRKQLWPHEMALFTVAIEAGYLRCGWFPNREANLNDLRSVA